MDDPENEHSCNFCLTILDLTHICREFANIAIYARYPERFCVNNLAVRKVFAFSDSGRGLIRASMHSASPPRTLGTHNLLQQSPLLILMFIWPSGSLTSCQSWVCCTLLYDSACEEPALTFQSLCHLMPTAGLHHNHLCHIWFWIHRRNIRQIN